MTPEPRILIVFYTSSGNTQKVAEAMATALSADWEKLRMLKPLEANIHGKSVGNFINIMRAGMHARGGHKADIQPLTHHPADYDLVIIGTPVYGGCLPAPVRAFCEQYGAQLKTTAFFCTGESLTNELVFELLQQASGKTPKATYAFHAPQILTGKFLPQVAEFVGQVMK
ncbi:MAG TPA: flavodoxin [Anaerolineae bacterium]|nr:flavodoxin [Anaerolineae bacterium]